MEVYGRASLSEYLGDFVVYRKLIPVDERLPGLEILRDRLSLSPGYIPRKSQLDYARVVFHQLQEAREIEAPGVKLERLIYLGDTRLLDVTAFNNLCEVGRLRGLAFIAAENVEAPAIVEQGALILANRWCSLEEFERLRLRRKFAVNQATAVVVDLDKTAIGARGRNDTVIDEARVEAMVDVVSGLLGESFELEEFRRIYHPLNQPRYHSFTADNQDYLAYICLILASGLFDPREVMNEVESTELANFEQFILRVDGQTHRLDTRLRATHEEILAYVQAGDPTPFKAFRAKEYLATIGRMGHVEDDTPAEELLKQEIVITQEVREAALAWRDEGALVFGLSDKPDESALPSRALAAQGYPALHRAITHVVGGQVSA